MNDKKIPKAFRFRLDALPCAAQRLLGALNDTVIGPPVAATLPATFLADFTAQIDLVEKHSSDQSGASGTLHDLTRSQRAARSELFRLASLARRAAVLAFPGQNPLLHSSFQVGIHEPKTLSSALDRARRLLAACEDYSDAMAAFGWPAAHTAALATAVHTLTGADQSQKAAEDARIGVTAQRMTGANLLYKQCLLVQNAARVVYTGAVIEIDPAAIEARARYLIGEFPPVRVRDKAIVASATAVTPAALTVVPAPVQLAAAA